MKIFERKSFCYIFIGNEFDRLKSLLKHKMEKKNYDKKKLSDNINLYAIV